MCTRHSEPHAHKVQFTKSTGVCLRMLIKNTHVVPAWAPSTAEDGMFTLEAESLLRVKSDGGSPSCSQHLYLEPRRLYSADIGFDLSSFEIPTFHFGAAMTAWYLGNDQWCGISLEFMSALFWLNFIFLSECLAMAVYGVSWAAESQRENKRKFCCPMPVPLIWSGLLMHTWLHFSLRCQRYEGKTFPWPPCIWINESI